MKKPAPVRADTFPEEALPHSGGSYVRLGDGTLQREEATDNSPEARAADLQDPVQSPVKEA